MTKECPTCKREFTSLQDYPEVALSKLEFPDGGFEMVQSHFGDPEQDKKAVSTLLENSQELATYLVKLRKLKQYALGDSPRTVLPSELLPDLDLGSYFRWAYEIPCCEIEGWDRYMQFYIGISNQDPGKSCSINIYRTGPNFGSAGGPTLIEIAIIAKVDYCGALH